MSKLFGLASGIFLGSILATVGLLYSSPSQAEGAGIDINHSQTYYYQCKIPKVTVLTSLNMVNKAGNSKMFSTIDNRGKAWGYSRIFAANNGNLVFERLRPNKSVHYRRSILDSRGRPLTLKPGTHKFVPGMKFYLGAKELKVKAITRVGATVKIHFYKNKLWTSWDLNQVPLVGRDGAERKFTLRDANLKVRGFIKIIANANTHWNIKFERLSPSGKRQTKGHILDENLELMKYGQSTLLPGSVFSINHSGLTFTVKDIVSIGSTQRVVLETDSHSDIRFLDLPNSVPMTTATCSSSAYGGSNVVGAGGAIGGVAGTIGNTAPPGIEGGFVDTPSDGVVASQGFLGMMDNSHAPAVGQFAAPTSFSDMPVSVTIGSFSATVTQVAPRTLPTVDPSPVGGSNSSGSGNYGGGGSSYGGNGGSFGDPGGPSSPW